MMVKQRGPIDVLVFAQLGQVFLFANGGFGADEHELVAYDFCGHKVGKDTDVNGLLGTFLEEPVEAGKSVSVGNASAIGRIQSTGPITIGILNHPNRDLYTARQIAAGVVQRLGELFLIPAVTWGPVTVAQITDDLPPVVRDCVKMIANAGIDNWSRIYFRDDGTFDVI
jgi:hypothetical protein